MPVFQRYLTLAEEAAYGVASTAPPLYLDLAGESLKRKPSVATQRPERRVAGMRQSDRGRAVSGSVDVHLGYLGLARVLRWLCGTPTTEDLGGGAFRDTFVPDPRFIPASLTAGVPRDVELHNYLGTAFNTARLSFGLNDQHFGLSLGCLGADEQPGGAVPDVLDSVFEAPAAILDRASATPLIITLSDGVTTWTAATESVDLNFSWDRKLRQPERRLTATGITGGGRVTASGKVKWFYGTDTDFLLDAFRSRASVALTLTMQGAVIAGSVRKTLEVHFPACKVNADPPTVKNAGAGNIDFAVDLEPLYNAAAGYPFRFRVTSGVPIVEMLINGDFESALGAEWTNNGGTTATWGRATSPTPQSGTYYALPTSSGSAERKQDVDVTAYAAGIDAGTKSFRFIGYLRVKTEAAKSGARFLLEYRDAANTAVLASDDTGTMRPIVWTPVTFTRTPPVGTRFLRVRMIGTRPSGGVGIARAYFDALSWTAL